MFEKVRKKGSSDKLIPVASPFTHLGGYLRKKIFDNISYCNIRMEVRDMVEANNHEIDVRTRWIAESEISFNYSKKPLSFNVEEDRDLCNRLAPPICTSMNNDIFFKQFLDLFRAFRRGLGLSYGTGEEVQESNTKFTSGAFKIDYLIRNIRDGIEEMILYVDLNHGNWYKIILTRFNHENKITCFDEEPDDGEDDSPDHNMSEDYQRAAWIKADDMVKAVLNILRANPIYGEIHTAVRGGSGRFRTLNLANAKFCLIPDIKMHALSKSFKMP